MTTKTYGFTLIELMVTLAVTAILVGVGIPAFRASIANNNVAAMTNQVITSLNYARARAVSGNGNVTVRTGDTGGGTGTDWSDGWIIYTSPAALTDYNAAADTLLKAISPNSKTLSIISDTGQYVTFRPNGMLADNSNAVITVCDDNAGSDVKGRRISLATTGRISVATITPDLCL